MKMTKFSMSLTLKQLKILEDALDLYTRVGIGQLEIIGEKLNTLFPSGKHATIPWKLKEKYLNKIKMEFFEFQSGQSYGIGHQKVSDKAKIGYDLQKTIQKTIAEKDDHNRMSVWHDGNILKLGSEPLAKITEK